MKRIDRVHIYASLGLRPGVSELLWTFRKRYEMEEFPVYLDDHPYQIHERIIEEQRHGMRTADIVILPHYMIIQMKSEGILSKAEPRESEAYPKTFVDIDKMWFAIGVTFMGIAYNIRKTEIDELPFDISELISGSWKGTVGIQSLTSSRAGSLGAHYICFLRKSLGEKRWLRLLGFLAEPTRVKTYDCIDHLLQGLVRGDHRLALTAYSLAYYRERIAGSPLALLEMDDMPKMPTFISVGLLRNSETNRSAKKFLGFLLSEEAQRILGGIPGIAPVRPGVEPSYQFELKFDSHTRFYPSKDDIGAIQEAMKTFRKFNLP